MYEKYFKHLNGYEFTTKCKCHIFTLLGFSIKNQEQNKRNIKSGRFKVRSLMQEIPAGDYNKCLME